MDNIILQNLLTQARALHGAGRNAEALTLVTQILAKHPTAAGWSLRGDIHLAVGELPAAAQAYGKAVKREPGNAMHHHDVARALLAAGRAKDAERSLLTAARLNAHAWDIMCDLGSAQLEQGKLDKALSAFTAALTLKPDAAPAHFNQGTALRDLGRLDEAEAAFRTAAHVAPTFLSPMISLITLLGDLGRLEEAQHWYTTAARLAPAETQVHQAWAMALLRHGALREGFSIYETRFQPSRFALPVRPFSYPQWRGESLAGKRLLVWTEQGVGDEIFSAGMFPDLIAAAESCTIECTERIAPLFQRSFPDATVVPRRDPPDAATQGSFDYQSAALSLGGILRSDLSQFPRHPGYLRADPELVATLRARYRARKPGAMVVGIAWDSTGRHGLNKRLPLELWSPILSQDGVTFVSLQYGARRNDPGLGNVLVDDNIDALKSLDAAAAQIAAMDLVITVSNTAAHMAGALNVPVWTLLPDGPGCLWYWFRERLDSPWYPSMRMFRQPRHRDWGPVVAQVAQALVELRAKGQL